MTAADTPELVADGRGLRRVYQMGRTELCALDGVDFRAARGEFVAIVGPSGSGKSTLMALLGCLDRPTEGSLSICGRDVAKLDDRARARIRNRALGFVFQSFQLIPRMSALDNVQVPLIYGRNPGAAERAREALDSVGLGDRVDHLPNEMSGGERQRVAIARAIVQRPPLLLADEPTGNLDTRTGDEILELLERLVADGVTMVMVTHDMDVAARAHRTVHLRDGRVEREVLQRVEEPA